MRHKAAQLIELIHFTSFEFLINILQVFCHVEESIGGRVRSVSWMIFLTTLSADRQITRASSRLLAWSIHIFRFMVLGCAALSLPWTRQFSLSLGSNISLVRFLNIFLQFFSLCLKFFVHLYQILHLWLVFLSIFSESFHQNFNLEFRLFKILLERGNEIIPGFDLIFKLLLANNQTVIFLLKFCQLLIESINLFLLFHLYLNHAGLFFRRACDSKGQIILKFRSLFI